jgi:hypothetical protein
LAPMLGREVVVRLKTPAGDVRDIRGSVSTDDRGYALDLEIPNLGPRRTVGPDQFECLLSIRAELEPLGFRFLVNGARRNVWPSGMLRDMGGGEQAYVLVLGQPGRPDLVDIFEPADESQIALIREQRDFHHTWLDDRRKSNEGGGATVTSV